METGSIIKAARKERRWTQETLAKKVGASRETVSWWENGERRPIPIFRQQLKRVLRVSLDE